MMGCLYFLPASESIETSNFDVLLSVISEERRKRINAFHFDVDKKLSLYAELIVRFAACEMLNISNSDIIIDTNEYGKPFLKNYPNFYFNVSHTRNAVVVCVAAYPIGVDIERVKKAKPDIAKRFFTTDEQQYVFEKNDLIDERFFEIWTKKEAYIKCLGKGLSIPLNSFSVLYDKTPYRIHTIAKGEYRISVCTEERFDKYSMIECKENELEPLFYALR